MDRYIQKEGFYRFLNKHSLDVYPYVYTLGMWDCMMNCYVDNQGCLLPNMTETLPKDAAEDIKRKNITLKGAPFSPALYKHLEHLLAVLNGHEEIYLNEVNNY